MPLKRSINFRLSISGVREKYLCPSKSMKIIDIALSHLVAFRRGDTGSVIGHCIWDLCLKIWY